MGSYLNIHPHYYSPDKLREYTGETITIVLNPGQGVRERGWQWLSMYCILATQNFGHVVIPENVNVIPYIDVSQFAFNFSLLISTLITGLHTQRCTMIQVPLGQKKEKNLESDLETGSTSISS